MKKFLTCVMFACVATTSVAAPKKAEPKQQATQFDAVKAFQTFVATASDAKSWVKVRQDPTSKRWVRLNIATGEVRYDVKKTDSLINPMIGVVSFPLLIKISPFADTEQEALDSVENPKLQPMYEVDISYHLVGEKWVMQEIKYKPAEAGNPLRGTTFTMDAAKLEREKNTPLTIAFLPWATLP